jgi:hypothetical protein
LSRGRSGTFFALRSRVAAFGFLGLTGVAVGVGVGVAMGVAVGVVVGVALGVAAGVAVGVSVGVPVGVSGDPPSTSVATTG